MPKGFDQRSHEEAQEKRALKRFVDQGVTNRWEAMAFKALQRKYRSYYESLLLKKNGGHWMVPFKSGEHQG